MSKRYDQYCPVCHALGLVGERWALLVVRELLQGPEALHRPARGLPGIGTNVLAARLRELEAGGVVRKRRLPPPAASTVYELTEYGQELEEPLYALARWGHERSGPPGKGDDLAPDWGLNAFAALLDPELPAGDRDVRPSPRGRVVHHAAPGRPAPRRGRSRRTTRTSTATRWRRSTGSRRASSPRRGARRAAASTLETGKPADARAASSRSSASLPRAHLDGLACGSRPSGWSCASPSLAIETAMPRSRGTRRSCGSSAGATLTPGRSAARGIERMLEQWDRHGVGLFSVLRKEDERLVGRVGYLLWDTERWVNALLEELDGAARDRDRLGRSRARSGARATRPRPPWRAATTPLGELGRERVISLIAPENVARFASPRRSASATSGTSSFGASVVLSALRAREAPNRTLNAQALACDR